MSTPSSKQKWFIRLLITGCVLLLLEFLPGAYTIDDFQDEWDLDSPEGLALLALEDLELEADLEFDRPTRQRISRNAELLVPEGTRLSLKASMTPMVIDDEAVARPRTWELRSSKYMTFVYRGVTVARAKRMQIRSDDPELRVRAIGTYRVLTALATAHRYHRQKEIRRAYEVPDRAVVNADARFLPNHDLAISETTTITTGEIPSRLEFLDLTWDGNRWSSGRLELELSLADPEPVLNDIASEELSEPIELGGVLAMKFRRLHALTLEEDRLFIHLDGSITSANSKTIEGIFDPSFEARLEFAFSFPEGQTLEEATLGARLKQIHTFDINRSNNLLDKSVRNIARGYRDELDVSYVLAQELPDHPAIPRNLTFDRFGFVGTKTGALLLDIQAHIPKEEPSSY